MSHRIINIVLALYMTVGLAAHGAEITYTGPLFGDYALDGNWSSGMYPGESDYAVLTGNHAQLYDDMSASNTLAVRVQGGGILEIWGGSYLKATKNSNWDSHVGNGSGSGYVDQYGGTAEINYLEVGRGGTGIYNLDGGTNIIARGKGGYSLYLGTDDSKGVNGGDGTYQVYSGTLLTRTGVYLGPNNGGSGTGTFSVRGGGADQIGIGTQGTGAGTWVQNSNSVLKVEIASDGITPIMIDDQGGVGLSKVDFLFGSILSVDFYGMAPISGSWPVMICDGTGTMTDFGMVFDPGMGSATNDWGWIVSNEVSQSVLYVGYGLGWPAGNATNSPPPAAGRDLCWTGGGGDTLTENAGNWLVDTNGTPLSGADMVSAVWGPYDGDLWHIADIAVPGIVSGINYVVDYNDTALNGSHLDLNIGNGAEGTLNYNSGSLNFALSSSTLQNIGNGGSDGVGTLNVNGGDLTFNAVRLGMGGAQGTININDGTLTIGRGRPGPGAFPSSSMFLGWGNDGTSSTGTGTLNITGGRMFTRGQVVLGVDGTIGTFCVEGSDITDIGIGSHNTIDGAWYQFAGSTLKVRIDDGGVTPIFIDEKDPANGGNDGHVYFYPGSLLDVDLLPGVTNSGTFDIMTWEGELKASGLEFAPGVDPAWTMAFVDTNMDGTNDTLRVANETPVITSFSLIGSDMEISWTTIEGYLYTLEYITDLLTNNWVELPPFINLTATGSSMSVSLPLASLTENAEFFRVRRDAPGPFLNEDFETASATNWTVTGAGTLWELGSPYINNPFMVLTNAASGVNCFGTDLDGFYNNDTDIILTSPPIVIGANPVVVEWAEAYDIEDDIVTVSVIDENAGTTNIVETRTLNVATQPAWVPRLETLPITPTGQTIRIQFRFEEVGAHDGAFAGWYIDDVVVRDL